MSSSKLGHKWWYLKFLLVLEGFKQLKPGLSINPYENYFFHTCVCNLAGWKDATCHIYKLFLRFSLSWKVAFCKYHRLWNSFVNCIPTNWNWTDFSPEWTDPFQIRSRFLEKDLDPIKIQKKWSAIRIGNCCVQFLTMYAWTLNRINIDLKSEETSNL